MKIAYFTEWSPYEPSGVLHKIISQVTAWTELGHEVNIYALAPSREMPPALEFGKHGRVFGRISEMKLASHPYARLGFFNKVVTVPDIRLAITSQAPDVIYYRQQGPWYPGISSILSLAPVVMEVNSNLAEDAYWGRFNGWFRSITQKRILSNVTGFVTVSHAIFDEYHPLGKPIEVVPNSMRGGLQQGIPQSGNTEPAFVFVGSPLTKGGAWHGIDKIMYLAEKLPHSTFNIIGLATGDLPDIKVPENVLIHGTKYGDELAAIYQASDVGIGTLALHRRSIDTTSALKPLEYLMHGLPVILGYKETEEQLNSADYTLSLSNYEANISDHIDEIDQFAHAWLGKRVTSDLSYLSREVIEKKRIRFMTHFAAL